MKPYFQRAGVTLYHGDCRQVLPTLAPGSVDALITDPPYGMDWDTDTTRFSGGKSERAKDQAKGRIVGRNDYGAVTNDAAPFDPSPWLGFPQVVLFGANHYAERLPRGTSLVWIKRSDKLFQSFLSDAEIAWMKGGHGVYCFRKEFPPPSRAMDAGGNPCNPVGIHPCQKPVSLMAWCMRMAKVPAGGLVFDPYAGSGTTGVACIQTGRKFIGVEIEERYCAIAAKRLEHAASGGPLFAAATAAKELFS